MTYACADIVYGIDMAHEGRDNPLNRFEDIIADMVDANVVQTAYNGSGDEPFWIGVSMCSLQEGDSDTDGLRLAPTEKDIAEYETVKAAALDFLAKHDDGLAAKLADHVRDAKPKVWIAWSSS